MATKTLVRSPSARTPTDLVIALMRAADRTRRAMIKTLQPFGLSLPQFNVLIILRHEQELPTLEVAARLVEEAPGITRLMTTLVSKGYIRRRQHRNDRRQQLCSLTVAGTQLIDRVIPGVIATQQGVARDLSPSQARAVVAGLNVIATSR